MANLLITGGTGSFGTTVLHKLIDETYIDNIIIYSRDECKQHRLLSEFDLPQQAKIINVIGDVRDHRRLLKTFLRYEPIFVFHAAALKRVPEGELHPEEMIQTNVLGTSNVIDCCDEVGAKCVLLSTDKACYPINVLGFSKALAERVALSPPGNTHAVVRYGNVLGSRGSLLEIWLRDAIAGRPILITDPAMTRFLLTLDQAVTLVTTALSGDPGLYILPAPATSIATLATAFQRIIKCPSRILNSTRAGEKKHECLLTAEEAAYSRKYSFNKTEYMHCTPNKPMIIDAENACEMLCSNTVPQLSVEQVIEIIKPIVEELAIKLTNF